MTQPMTDDTTHNEQTTAERFHEWRKAPASVTNEHLLLSRAVWTLFLAISAFVGYRQLRLDNELTREQVEAAIVRESDNCAERNARREAGERLAAETLAADQASLNRDQRTLDNDVANWTTIDGLFPEGLPEPARTTVFSGLEDRQAAIDEDQLSLDGRFEGIDATYALEPCPTIAGSTVPPDE